MCNRIRRSDRLSLRLGRISLSGVRIFVFDWLASGWRPLDSGALHVRFRSGNIQLLWADQSSGTKYGLSQRAPRFALGPVAQSAEAAHHGTGVLQQSEISLFMEPVTVAVHF